MSILIAVIGQIITAVLSNFCGTEGWNFSSLHGGGPTMEASFDHSPFLNHTHVITNAFKTIPTLMEVAQKKPK
ncbi:hypothetical protein XENTR_v10006195 [Xenopus tropicalis]|nr:hypothetical protein XENTR_v10006195 [Xenopus tropicalis]